MRPISLTMPSSIRRLGLQGAGLWFRIFPANEGNAEGLFASCRRVAAHVFVVHTIVAEIGAIADGSNELGDVALGNPSTVAAICGFQDPYGIGRLFRLRDDNCLPENKGS